MVRSEFYYQVENLITEFVLVDCVGGVFVVVGRRAGIRSRADLPPVQVQTHAPGIVECSNGDLIASWYGDVSVRRFGGVWCQETAR